MTYTPVEKADHMNWEMFNQICDNNTVIYDLMVQKGYIVAGYQPFHKKATRETLPAEIKNLMFLLSLDFTLNFSDYSQYPPTFTIEKAKRFKAPFRDLIYNFIDWQNWYYEDLQKDFVLKCTDGIPTIDNKELKVKGR